MKATSEFNLIRRAVRAIPDRLPGKTRLARAALHLFPADETTLIPDRFGNLLHLPSLKEPISVALFACGIYEPDTLSAILHHLPAAAGDRVRVRRLGRDADRWGKRPAARRNFCCHSVTVCFASPAGVNPVNNSGIPSLSERQ